MYKIRRIIGHRIIFGETVEDHAILKSNSVFLLTDEEFEFLKDLPCEYVYTKIDNEFYLDRHPDIIREGVSNEFFIKDYEEHLTDKYFVVYEYTKVEEDV